MTTPKNTSIRRSLRRFTLGSGPLKRRSDRVQVVGRFVVVLSFLVAPPLAVAAATAMTGHLQAVAAADAAERSRIRAVLLENAPARTRASSDHGDASSTTVPVWVNREGAPTRAPLDPAGIPTAAAAAAAVPLVGVPLVTWTAYALLCRALDIQRERRWAHDWAEVEPDWNSRLR